MLITKVQECPKLSIIQKRRLLKQNVLRSGMKYVSFAKNDRQIILRSKIKDKNMRNSTHWIEKNNFLRYNETKWF